MSGKITIEALEIELKVCDNTLLNLDKTIKDLECQFDSNIKEKENSILQENEEIKKVKNLFNQKREDLHAKKISILEERNNYQISRDKQKEIKNDILRSIILLKKIFKIDDPDKCKDKDKDNEDEDEDEDDNEDDDYYASKCFECSEYVNMCKCKNEVKMISKLKYEQVKNNGGFLTEYHNRCYCENCEGWDGRSHRCECGNRRMRWNRVSVYNDQLNISYEAY